MGLWVFWADRMHNIGPAGFYTGFWCDYMPGYLYVLWMLGQVRELLPGLQVYLLLKLPNLLADVATAGLIWWSLGPTRAKNRLWAPAFYLFNPAILMNSTLWGQADSYHALWMVLGLVLVSRRRPEWAAVVFGYALAVKPHTLVVLPLAAIHALTDRVKWYRVAASAFIVVAAFMATFLPFAGWSITSLPSFIHERFAITMGQYEYASVNAMNLWYLLGMNWTPDGKPIVGGMSARTIGTILFALCYAATLAWAWFRRKDSGAQTLWSGAAIICLATFLFVTRAHERHLFPFFAMGAMLMGLRSVASLPWLVLSVFYTFNLIHAWQYLYDESVQLCAPPLGMTLCVIALVALPAMFVTGAGVGQRRFDRIVTHFANAPKLTLPADPEWVRKRWAMILALIVLFALLTRIIRLDEPDAYVYDEVYHAYTAGQWAQDNYDTWPWSRRPTEKDVANEWTHPPLAKLVMSWSIRAFGLYPWAWRLPAALLGTSCVPLIFVVARRLFASNGLALLAAGLYALDTLPLFSSRMGMNDIYMLSFMLAAVAAALYRLPVPAAIAAGLALACKWSAVFGIPVLGLIHVLCVDPRRRWKVDRLAVVLAAYVTFVPAAYVICHTPFFPPNPRGVEDFTRLHAHMWSYHTGLKDQHAYASPAYLWPTGKAYIWCYTSGGEDLEKDLTKEQRRRLLHRNVFAIGNPVIWISGLCGLLVVTLMLIRRGDLTLILVLLGYLLFWAPWLASPRIMFVTHYLPALPFLYLALAWAMVYTRARRSHLLMLTIAAGIAFLAIYPFVTSIPIPGWLDPRTWR